jgi:hypothetical protein
VLGLNPHAVMVGLWYRRRAFEANNKKYSKGTLVLDLSCGWILEVVNMKI